MTGLWQLFVWVSWSTELGDQITPDARRPAGRAVWVSLSTELGVQITPDAQHPAGRFVWVSLSIVLGDQITPDGRRPARPTGLGELEHRTR